MSMGRTLVWRACAGAMALLVAAVAQAQVQLPRPIPPGLVAMPLARAGVALPPERFVEIWTRYSEAYEQCVLQLIEDQRKTGTRGAPGSLQPIPGTAEQKRLEAVSDRILAAEDQLRTQLYGALAEAALNPEDRQLIEQIAAAESVAGAYGRLDADLRGMQSAPRLPQEIGHSLRMTGSTPKEDDAAARAQWRARAELAAARASERRAAALEARKKIMELRRERAAEAAAAGTSGKSPAEVSAARSKAIKEAFEKAKAEGRTTLTKAELDAAVAGLGGGAPSQDPGPDPFERLRRVQIDTYRDIEARLSQEQRDDLVDSWFASVTGTDSPPPNIGMLFSPRGFVRVNFHVAELLRQPALDEAARERVRTFGRAWIKDDHKIRADALQALLRTGKLPDVTAQRAERAEQAKREIGSIPGLEFFAENVVVWPQLSDPLSEADAREFGDVVGRRPQATDSNAMVASLTGLPVNYLDRDQKRIGELLELDEARAALLGQLFDRAREEWKAQLEPLLGDRTKLPAAGELRGVEAIRAYEAATRAAQQARDDAWIRASAIDSETLGAMAAALGGEDAAPVLALYRAARAASQPLPGRFATDNLATVLLGAPLHRDELRAASRAAAPLLDEWVAAHRAMVGALRAKQAADRSKRGQAGAPAEPVPGGAQPSAEEAGRAVTAAQERLDRAEAALSSAVEASLGEAHRHRWQALAKWNAAPNASTDPRPLWKIEDALPERVPAAQRDAVAAASAATVRRAVDRMTALSGAAMPLLGEESRRGGLPDLQFFMPALQAITVAQLWMLVPAEMDLTDLAPSENRNFLRDLQRLRVASTGAAAAPAATTGH